MAVALQWIYGLIRPEIEKWTDAHVVSPSDRTTASSSSGRKPVVVREWSVDWRFTSGYVFGVTQANATQRIAKEIARVWIAEPIVPINGAFNLGLEIPKAIVLRQIVGSTIVQPIFGRLDLLQVFLLLRSSG